MHVRKPCAPWLTQSTLHINTFNSFCISIKFELQSNRIALSSTIPSDFQARRFHLTLLRSTILQKYSGSMVAVPLFHDFRASLYIIRIASITPASRISRWEQSFPQTLVPSVTQWENRILPDCKIRISGSFLGEAFHACTFNANFRRERQRGRDREREKGLSARSYVLWFLVLLSSS